MTPFTVHVPQAKLDAILTRVRGYPWFSAPADEGPGWGRGINTAFLMDICAYWVEGFDWRAQEALLNRWPQYRVDVAADDVETLPIHFVHVVGEAGGARPLLLTHGWPGSHFEFWGLIEKLAFPSRFGGTAADAFDLVIPSLPGYGFSGRPAKPMGQRATARLFNSLMTGVLGYPRYLAQGGDWGGMVTSWLGLEHTACIGVHLNMIGFRPTPAQPRNAEEAQWLTRTRAAMQAEGAYFMQQATKPQTLAMALMDSPVGTAAWILEKFHGWSDLGAGGLLDVYTRDQLLTNVMLYVATDSIATSVWYYRALFEEGGISLPEGVRCETPTAFANFPGEKLYAPPPRSWAERAYAIRRWTDMASGGHFAAMERPDLLIADVQAFARDLGY